MTQNVRQIGLVDTTLRDGHQAPGVVFSLETREALIKALDEANVDRIEALAPGFTPKETAAAKRWSRIPKRAKIIAWNRLKLSDVEASMALKPHIIHVCFPASKTQLRKKLNMDFDAAAGVLEKCLDLARVNGFEVSVGLEDASRVAFENLTRIRTLLRYLQVENIRVSDTCGVLTPTSTRRLVEYFNAGNFTVEFHAHDDLGMAEVNSLIAALSGAQYVHTSLRGLGERAGNAAFSAFVKLAEKSNRIALGLTSAEAQAIEETFGPWLARDQFMSFLKTSPGSDVTDWIAQHSGPQSFDR
ncbi:MAG: homocitrate synthase [Deltaproteobacteria bacterium]|jgi:homocitrate synthase NifV|nr:homocitrate synthase [Deltaproteobacteria bacterium]